jgi:ketosteroid isomerase-like protein
MYISLYLRTASLLRPIISTVVVVMLKTRTLCGNILTCIHARPSSRGIATTSVSAKDVVTTYYEAYNEKDIDRVLSLFSDDIIYEDLIYQEPFRGKGEVATYFGKIGELVPKDIKFVVDDITGESDRCGVMWHVEIESDQDGLVELPFSRGASFYRIDPETRKIVFARDLVEPSLKPGSMALQGITVVAPLIRTLGNKANPANIATPDGKNLVQAGLMYGFSVTYILVVLLSTIPPGSPLYHTDIADIERIMHESFNFFYVNIGMDAIGLPTIVPNVAEHPVDEGIFNFINAWSLMFLPLMVADPKGSTIPWKQKLQYWVGVMFLTNVFMPFYMSQRLIPDIYQNSNVTHAPESLQQGKSGSLGIGIVSCLVACVSLGWIAIGRPEYSAADRIAFFTFQFTHDRVFWAFCLDAVLYSVWQYWILSDVKAPTWQRVTPLFGLSAWLLTSSRQDHGKSS